MRLSWLARGPNTRWNGRPARCFFLWSWAFAHHAAALVVAFALALLPAVALARQGDGMPVARVADGEVDIQRLEVGLGGVMRAERFGPLTAWITSGSVPWSGVLRVRYQQDDTQDVIAELGVATTPGSVVPIEVMAALPRSVQRIEFEFLGPGGAKRIVYSSNPRSNELPMPGVVGDELVVLGVGEGSLRTLLEGLPPDDGTRGTGDDSPEFNWRRVAPVQTEAARLPLSWMGYDGVEVLVVRGDLGAPGEGTSLDPRRMDALRAWIRAGGRAVVRLAGAGDEHRKLLGEASAFVEAAETSRVRVPPELMSVLRKADAADDLGHEIQARLVRVTPEGEAHGWRVAWEASPDRGVRRGFIATGPMGLGMVTIVGFDPSRAAKSLSAGATGAIWREIVFPHMDALPGRWVDGRTVWGSAGGPDPEASWATGAAINAITRVPPLGHGVFVAVALAVGLLALAMGPFDFLVLGRRRARHRSWLTALAWIVIASVVAGMGPTFFRSGRGVLSRWRATDVVLPMSPRGGVDSGGEARAWTAGVSGIFAPRPGQHEYVGPRPDSWWRGFSVAEYWGRRAPSLAPLRTAQGSSGGLRGGPALGAAAAQWTFRSLLDQSPESAMPEWLKGVRPIVRREGTGWRVRVEGLPASATAACAIEDRPGFRSVGKPLDNARTEFSFAPTQRFERSIEGWRQSGQRRWQNTLQRGFDADSFPAHRERSIAGDALLRSGRWVAVVLDARGLSSDIKLGGSGQGGWPGSWDVSVADRVRFYVPLDAVDATAPLDADQSEGWTR